MSELNRILIVEDDPDIQRVAEIALSLAGMKIETCSSGAEAITRASASHPQLILLDAMMPGIDGPATLAELRKNPPTADIPVIFMTARVQPQDLSLYRRIGGLDVVEKPFDPARLAEKLRQAWETRRGPAVERPAAPRLPGIDSGKAR